MKTAKTLEDLHEAIVDLILDHKSLPSYEIGFAIITIASQMLYDCAPSKEMANKTIQAGVDEGHANYLRK